MWLPVRGRTSTHLNFFRAIARPEHPPTDIPRNATGKRHWDLPKECKLEQGVKLIQYFLSDDGRSQKWDESYESYEKWKHSLFDDVCLTMCVCVCVCVCVFNVLVFLMYCKDVPSHLLAVHIVKMSVIC